MSTRYYTGIAPRTSRPLRHAIFVEPGYALVAGYLYRSVCGVQVSVDDIGSRFAPSRERTCSRCRNHVARAEGS